MLMKTKHKLHWVYNDNNQVLQRDCLCVCVHVKVRIYVSVYVCACLCEYKMHMVIYRRYSQCVSKNCAFIVYKGS